MSFPAPRLRFTVEDFQGMARAGIIDSHARVELIDGEIYEMTPIDSPHAAVVNRLTRLWTSRLGTRAIAQIQGPVAIGSHTQLQPDVSLLVEAADFYAHRLIEPAHVLLVNEVSSASLRYDRAKLPRYAAASIREVWLVDIEHERVEIQRSPGRAACRDVRIAARGDTIAPLAFPDVVLGVDEILG